ncbi:ABSCISIC ACID-INSENSITIVE 5-like protein 3 [Hirschfeldia incana]|nr:ABSCISIC ACID-INSENSITIVE 5-like protein 3 [Hirschfeldia incana]
MGSLRGNVEEPISQSLPRQNSLYSLKLHEVQTHLGSSAKPLGSMNLDELLKSVWSAEATNQPPEATEAGLSRQGSLALPRGLSKKTVEEVWRDIQQDKNGGSANPHGERIDSNNDNNKQPTLGEITLEDLLLKAGVVTETIVPQNVVNVASNGQWAQYHQPQPHHQHQGFMPYPVCEMQEMVSLGGFSDAPQAHGRKRVAPSGGGIVEKVVERRQKRMIKNRESAARSRARKQAYTHELEIKVSSLEEENEKLRRLKEVEKILPSEPPPDPKWKLRRTSSASF